MATGSVFAAIEMHFLELYVRKNMVHTCSLALATLKKILIHGMSNKIVFAYNLGDRDSISKQSNFGVDIEKTSKIYNGIHTSLSFDHGNAKRYGKDEVMKEEFIATTFILKMILSFCELLILIVSFYVTNGWIYISIQISFIGLMDFVSTIDLADMGIPAYENIAMEKKGM
ncbi:hypothetical protein ACJX0J_006641, partial [Zea mays]